MFSYEDLPGFLWFEIFLKLASQHYPHSGSLEFYRQSQ
jgi:hypothetical protein